MGKKKEANNLVKSATFKHNEVSAKDSGSYRRHSECRKEDLVAGSSYRRYSECRKEDLVAGSSKVEKFNQRFNQSFMKQLSEDERSTFLNMGVRDTGILFGRICCTATSGNKLSWTQTARRNEECLEQSPTSTNNEERSVCDVLEESPPSTCLQLSSSLEVSKRNKVVEGTCISLN